MPQTYKTPMDIILGSRSQPKILALRDAASRVFPDHPHRVMGSSAKSQVSAHPSNPHEARLGAMYRAHGAKEAIPDADLWVGIEGGLEEVSLPIVTDGGWSYISRWHEYGFVYVLDGEGNIGYGRTSGIRVPDHFMPIILSGGTLNDAVEEFHGIPDIGNDLGATGLLTSDVLSRRTLYINGIVEALSQLKNQELYLAPA